MVYVRKAPDAEGEDTTAAYMVVEDGVEAADAAAGNEAGEAEAAFAAKEVWWGATPSRPFACLCSRLTAWGG